MKRITVSSVRNKDIKHDIALILDASSVMSMVTLSWIVHTGYLLQEPQQIITNTNLTDAAMPDQVQGTIMKTGTGKVIPDHNLIFTDIAAWVVMILTEATPGPNLGIISATPGVAHNAQAPHIEITAIDPAIMHHINHTADHPCIEVLQLTTPEIVVDHAHDHPTNLQGKTCTGHIHIPPDHEANCTSRRMQGWKSKIYMQTITALMNILVTQERRPTI